MVVETRTRWHHLAPGMQGQMTALKCKQLCKTCSASASWLGVLRLPVGIHIASLAVLLEAGVVRSQGLLGQLLNGLKLSLQSPALLIA